MTDIISDVALHGSAAAAARAAGIPQRTYRDRYQAALRQRDINVPKPDPVPDPLMPVEDLIAHRKAQFSKKRAHKSAMLWRRYHVPTTGPYALMFFGDPHLDDDGCDIELFESHAELAASTHAVYAVNIGDTTNNWVGRLAALYSRQDIGAETAKAMVKHYLGERGIPWFLWLCGNHDLWDGPVGRDVFARHAPNFVQMHDWQAKVTLVSPNGHELRLWAAHNFKGNSLWNNLHGLERAAQMQDWAHLYVAGHHHDCGLRQGENVHRRFVYNLMRVRGFKFMDDYADQHGFGEYQYGASGMAVIDPSADKLNAVTCFLDPFEGADFLAFKRRSIAA